ncbi:M50 family metallopeptidase [Cryptosporangium arvum]|uniref:Putative membrane-associated Zn-dependent protease n=1 Tax=Cryptosporangium arvum DSM 44712 TaxID=927661 RepID=A0A010YNW0_9ACTN|nr:site-2 protease family protein [Cryptosporangium arvum]EXG81860.1 putative membrane-associated Zn-dependent protease [Cryptosporangium arvum DSM 44712]
MVVGVALFALGILLSLVLHEAGHLGAARMFGMKVTRFFVGYGRTLGSFRRGGIEYGVKAIPAGAFVSIVGMVRQFDESDDDPRAMWRFPLWKRTVVMTAGVAANVAFGTVLIWGMFAFTPLPDADRLQSEPVRVATVSDRSAAARLGLRPGDVVTTLDGRVIRGWDSFTRAVRASGGRTLEIGYRRDGRPRTGSAAIPLVDGAGQLGVTADVPRSAAGPVDAIALTGTQTATMVTGAFAALVHLPERVPAVWNSLTGDERDPEAPVSMVGASHLGGQLADRGEWPSFVLLLAGLNFFLAAFNLVPLLPLDGGHVSVWWFERGRSWLYARLRRPDPGQVDYLRLAPITYVAILIFAAFSLLTVAADVVNPVLL